MNRWLTIVFVCLSCSGCTMTDPEYSQKLTQARTDFTGKEIVGVWVSRAHNWAVDGRITLLLRPDGTGVYRISMNAGATPMESPFKWSYAGGGVWKAPLDDGKGTLMFRFTGHDLLSEARGPMGMGELHVLVSA